MLPSSEYRRLRPAFVPVTLQVNDVLFSPGDPVRYIYFPDDAVVSLLFDVDARRKVEVAMEGNEGAVGFAVYLGGTSSHNLAIVRDAGTAIRFDVKTIKRLTGERGRLPELLNKYMHALVTQVAQSSVCNRFHDVDARLVRWLLMTRDRLGSGELCATQESIAQLLGVRRSSVSGAARNLHNQNLIDYRRGRIVILDQCGLHAASCACYGIIKRQYDSFLK